MLRRVAPRLLVRLSLTGVRRVPIRLAKPENGSTCGTLMRLLTFLDETFRPEAGLLLVFNR